MNAVKGIPLSDIPRGPLCALYVFENIYADSSLGDPYTHVLETLHEQGFAQRRLIENEGFELYQYSLTAYGSSSAIQTLRAMSQPDYVADVLPLLRVWGDGTGIDCAVCERQTRFMGLTVTHLRMLHCPTCGHMYTVDKEATFTTLPDWYLEEQAEALGLTKKKKRARATSKKDKAWFAKRGLDEHGNTLLGYGDE